MDSQFAAGLEKRLRSNLFDSVIPFWEQHSLDAGHGGMFTCLTREGQVFDTRKYMWMQGRAVWTFSRLYNTVERRPEWLAAAREILEFSLRNGFDSDGRCYFALTCEGQPASIQRKPYAAFFILLGLTEFIRSGAPAAGYLTLAKDLFQRIEAWMADGTLLGRPALAGQTPVRQLADIYVRAFMAMAMMPLDADGKYVRTLHTCLAEAREHWLAPQRTLLENLPLNGAPYGASPDTRLLCPGSALEVAWMLWHVLETLGIEDAEYEKFLLEVIEGSLELGWDKDHGGLYYFMDADGLPPLQLEANMKLWWPHTEALYALVLAYTKTGEEKWRRWIERVETYTFQTFVDARHGEWFGYCDRYGKPALETKGGPYKGFFHVPRCLLFSVERLSSALQSST